MHRHDFDIDRDRYFEIEGVAKDSLAVIMPITNPIKLIFRMREVSDHTIILEKTTDVVTEIENTDPANGEYRVYINIADTTLLAPGLYEYEVVYIDDPASPVEVYNLNPTEDETGYVHLKDVLVDV